METGFYRITADEYHRGAWAEFISRTRLFRTLRSPLHGITEEADKPAYSFGRAFHVYVLQRQLFESLYAIRPEDLDGRTKDGKAWLTENAAKEILSFQDGLKLQAMALALKRSKQAKELLTAGEAEVSGCWPDPKFPEITCKMRMDCINKSRRAIVDLKKVQDCRRFERDAWLYGYDMEAAWYLYGATQITQVTHNDFFFVAVEEQPPHGVMVYKASEELIGLGLERCASAMERIKECQDAAEWPGYTDEIKELYAPSWAKKEMGVIWEGGF